VFRVQKKLRNGTYFRNLLFIYFTRALSGLTPLTTLVLRGYVHLFSIFLTKCRYYNYKIQQLKSFIEAFILLFGGFGPVRSQRTHSPWATTECGHPAFPSGFGRIVRGYVPISLSCEEGEDHGVGIKIGEKICKKLAKV